MTQRALYRAMMSDVDGLPVVGVERNNLGLRPMEAALSVFLDPRKIPMPIRPKAVLNAQGQRGSNAETQLYVLDESELPVLELQVGDVNAATTHATIESSDLCSRDELHRRLVATRSLWRPT